MAAGEFSSGRIILIRRIKGCGLFILFQRRLKLRRLIEFCRREKKFCRTAAIFRRNWPRCGLLIRRSRRIRSLNRGWIRGRIRIYRRRLRLLRGRKGGGQQQNSKAR